MNSVAAANGWRRLVVTVCAGVATGILVRLSLLLLTRPHSVLLPTLPMWQAGISIAAGVTCGLVLIRALRSISMTILVSSVVALAAVFAVRCVLFDVGLAERFVPNLWVK
jgi:hypothetical protein